MTLPATGRAARYLRIAILYPLHLREQAHSGNKDTRNRPL